MARLTVEQQRRVAHNVYSAWLNRLTRSMRILQENGVYLTRDLDYAYNVAENVKGTRVVEQRSGICRVEYVDAVPADSVAGRKFKKSL
jgi:hypothetical protein